MGILGARRVLGKRPAFGGRGERGLRAEPDDSTRHGEAWAVEADRRGREAATGRAGGVDRRGAGPWWTAGRTRSGHEREPGHDESRIATGEVQAGARMAARRSRPC
jgi:hypothetical protein